MNEKESLKLLWQMNKNLEEILSKLNKLVTLYELDRQHEIEGLKEKVLGRSRIRRAIYNLCDGTKTVQEIAKQVGKSIQQVSMALTVLEESNLVKPKVVGRKKYYIRML